jgi:hypothetical protein
MQREMSAFGRAGGRAALRPFFKKLAFGPTRSGCTGGIISPDGEPCPGKRSHGRALGQQITGVERNKPIALVVDSVHEVPSVAVRNPGKHQITPYPWWTSSSLCPDLGFRYTQGGIL